MFKKLCRFKLCLFLCMLTGCAGPLGNGRGWGRDTAPTPRVRHISSAAGEAFRDPRTWLPAAGALALNLSGWDKKVSNWAGAKTPVFGTNAQAEDAGAAFGTAAELGFVSTALLTPSGQYVGEYTTGIGLPGAKPDRPAAGSASAFFYAAQGRNNAEAMGLDPKTRTFLDFAFTTAAAGSAWGEVEAKTNSPSNALVSAALNNFFVKFLYKSFLGGDPREKHLGIAVDAQNKGVSMEFNLPF